MSIQTFTAYLADHQATLNGQASFSKYYTAWLDDTVLADSGVHTWLQTQLSSPQLAEFDAGQWNIDVQQNSKTAAPIIHFADGTTFGLDGLFAADLADGKESFTPKDHARYYVDEAVVPQPPPPSILAVAFTDQNGNHTYEAGTDLLIASLLDTNNDGIVSAGDTIHWGTYPTSFSGTPRGTFQGPDLTVTSVDQAVSFHVLVETSEGKVEFGPQGGIDSFRTFPTGGSANMVLADPYASGLFDILLANTTGPGHPDTSIGFSTTPAAGNQSFLDVLLFV